MVNKDAVAKEKELPYSTDEKKYCKEVNTEFCERLALTHNGAKAIHHGGHEDHVEEQQPRPVKLFIFTSVFFVKAQRSVVRLVLCKNDVNAKFMR